MPVNRKMMANMKHEYGEKKGESVYYAMENKMKKTKYHGSGVFTAKDEDKGYKVLCSSNDLNKMDIDRVENVPEAYRLAKRRESTVGSHSARKSFRRSESTKGSY